MLTLRDAVSGCCLRRILTWRIPPHWSSRDWKEEMQAVVDVAALQAEAIYDPALGASQGAFLYRRILASALTRHRQEWAFAWRCASCAEPESLLVVPSLLGGFRFSPAPDSPWGILSELSEPERQLLRQLFWEEETEVEIAHALGISQQAVSKRKRALLKTLRRRLDENRSGEEEKPAGVIPPVSAE